MLKIIIAIFIFCLVLFLYLHIQFNLKTSNDLEIYELEHVSKEKMEEICDLRQPVLFDCDEDGLKMINTTNRQYLTENYPEFEIRVGEGFDKLGQLGQTRKTEWFSEGNDDFLQETGAVKNMSYNDEYLRPYLVSNCFYDVLFASSGFETPLRYELNYRNFFMVTQGSVRVKLTPPQSSKYLYKINDYENFAFKSPVNPWNPQTKFKNEFNKIKCLEFDLLPGRFLYIPAYWWYSFKFGSLSEATLGLSDSSEANKATLGLSEANKATLGSSICCLKYRTYINNLSISPHIFMYYLQNMNVTKRVVTKERTKEEKETEEEAKEEKEEKETEEEAKEVILI